MLKILMRFVCRIKGHDTSSGDWQRIFVTSVGGEVEAKISCNRCGKMVKTKDIVIERDGSVFNILDKRSGQVDSDTKKK